MGSFSIWHWMVVLLVVLLLFGSGKISGLMGDFAKGIKSFKKNMADDAPDASMEADATRTVGAPGTLSGPATPVRPGDTVVRPVATPSGAPTADTTTGRPAA